MWLFLLKCFVLRLTLFFLNDASRAASLLRLEECFVVHAGKKCIFWCRRGARRVLFRLRISR